MITDAVDRVAHERGVINIDENARFADGRPRAQSRKYASLLRLAFAAMSDRLFRTVIPSRAWKLFTTSLAWL